MPSSLSTLSSIPLSRLGGTSSIELFLCGICEHLAVDPLIHDGGYNQNFCQRFYCRSCLPVRIGNPLFGRVNRFGRRETNCVHHPNCLVDFNHPYFRKPSGLERQKYNKIVVHCDSCRQWLVVVNYLAHVVDCVNRVPVELRPGSLIHSYNNIIIGSPIQPFVALSMNFRRQQVTSNNQLRLPVSSFANNNINLFIRSSVGSFHQSFNSQISSEDALQQIASLRNMDATKIDLVYFCHFSARQFELFSDFCQECPWNGSVNLLERNGYWENTRYDARLCFISFPPQPTNSNLITVEESSDSSDSGLNEI